MIKFSKYHGCGNSFIIIEYEEIKNSDVSKLALAVCNRETGIGADGMIVVKQDPLEMIFYNQDGSTAPMCGNGIRCFSKYVRDKHYVKDKQFVVLTGAGNLEINCIGEEYEIAMGIPNFDPSLLHLKKDVDLYSYPLLGYELSSVFVGTIHTVVFVNALIDVDVEALGKKICNHELYKEKTNVNFVEVIDRQNIRVITYERGVGITKACGTGCCASFVFANHFNKVDKCVNIHLEYGRLVIRYDNEQIMMKGPATFVAEGHYNIKEEQLC